MVLGAAAAFIPRRDGPAGSARALLLALALLPALFAYAASLLTRPVLLDRYLIGSLPALVVLATTGVSRWLPGRWLAAAAAVVVAVTGTLGLAYAMPDPRPDWRAAAAYIAPRLQPGDCTVVHPAYNDRTWRYYAPGTCRIDRLERAEAPLRHLFYASETAAPDEPELVQIAQKLRLVGTTQVSSITVYEFAADQ